VGLVLRRLLDILVVEMGGELCLERTVDHRAREFLQNRGEAARLGLLADGSEELIEQLLRDRWLLGGIGLLLLRCHGWAFSQGLARPYTEFQTLPRARSDLGLDRPQTQPGPVRVPKMAASGGPTSAWTARKRNPDRSEFQKWRRAAVRLRSGPLANATRTGPSSKNGGGRSGFDPDRPHVQPGMEKAGALWNAAIS